MAGLTIALGDYPHTRALKSHAVFGGLAADYVEVKPISRAFAPMAREGRFDVSEMALMTFLLARAYGKPLVLLPVALMARFQEGSLLCRGDDATIRGPADLRGKRVGVRAYAQTTGVWLRGVLADDYGLAADSMRWVTFEDAHVAEYRDPPHSERAPAGSDMLAMLAAGDLDAVIVGGEKVDDSRLRTVFPDPAAAAERFRGRHGFMPVNHMVAVRRPFVEGNPAAVVELLRALRTTLAPDSGRARADALPFGRRALDPVIRVALGYCFAQGLLPRELSLDEVWEGTPAEALALDSD